MATEFIAGPADEGARLDAFVAARTGLPRTRAAALIAAGEVTVDGARAAKAARLAAGARVEVVRPAEAEPGLRPEDVSVPVVFEDEHLLVVDKPAGMVVHPGAGHARGTLAAALLARGASGGAPERPGIVHRLDAGTSGLMVVAKGEPAYGALVEAMAARRIGRVYLALTEGVPDTDTLTIDAPIGRSPRHRKKMAVVAGGKAARTAVTVLERHPRSALVEVRPETGRTHQIRVHLAAAGHPVAGDAVYGRDRALGRALGLARPFLHAARLSFEHPVTGDPLAFEAALPADLIEALARARTA